MRKDEDNRQEGQQVYPQFMLIPPDQVVQGVQRQEKRASPSSWSTRTTPAGNAPIVTQLIRGTGLSSASLLWRELFLIMLIRQLQPLML